MPDIDVKVFHLGRTLFSRGSREINRIKSLPTGIVSSRFPHVASVPRDATACRLKRNTLLNLFGACPTLLHSELGRTVAGEPIWVRVERWANAAATFTHHNENLFSV